MIYARSRSLSARQRRQLPAPLIGLIITVIWLVALLLVIDKVYAQSIGDIGYLGTLMSPHDGTPAHPLIPSDAIVTESGLGIQTESAVQIIEE